MTLPPISLCMIIKNEAAHLERCLSSVEGLVAEIIIADTGSSDGSAEIARRLGARVMEIPWENDFAHARNLTLREAAFPWILVLDADEAADGWNGGTVQQVLNTSGVQGFFLPFIHYVGEEAGGEYVTDNVCRLFRNDADIFFRGSIHEEAASSIWALPGGKISYANLPVHHYGYLDTELQYKNKAARNLQLIRDALRREPHSLPLLYALGTEYYQQEQYGPAAEILYPLLEQIPPDTGYAADLYLKAAYALQASGRTHDAKAVYTRGLSLFPDFTDMLESYARLLLQEEALQEPLRLLELALQSGNTARKYPSSSGSGTHRTRLLAGQMYERLFRYEEAKLHYEQAVLHAPGSTAAWEELTPLCLLSSDAERLAALTRRLSGSLPPDTLRRLVPSALNARAADWLAALAEAPQLPAPVRSVLEVLPEMLRQHGEGPPARLERLLAVYPAEQPVILGYLWAWSCRTGDAASAERWLGSLARYRPGLPAVLPLLAEAQPAAPGATPPDFADLAYAVQLLTQAGAWASLLALHRNTPAALLVWTRLPQPLLSGLLQAPASMRQQWCQGYSRREREQPHRTPAAPAEWLLRAAVAGSCGLPAQLEPEDEQALRSSGSTAALIGLGYHKLQQAAEAAAGDDLPPGRIPWLLLARSALRGS